MRIIVVKGPINLKVGENNDAPEKDVVLKKCTIQVMHNKNQLHIRICVRI